MLVERGPGWRLSGRGWAALLLLAAAAFLTVIRGLYPFLAVTQRVPTDVLVVDGWLPTFDLAQAAAEYRQGHYRLLLVVRAAYGYDAVDHDRGNAEMLQQVLHRFGVPSDHLAAVIFPGVRRDRTRGAAEAIKAWFQARGLPLPSLNVFTLGPHARRTRLVYEKVLSGAAVGVIAGEDPSYDPRRWWEFSDGVREVPFEGLAYLVARL